VFSDTAPRQVGAEGFFHDDARSLDQASLTQRAHDSERGVRRNAQIMQPAAFAADRLFRLLYSSFQRCGARGQRHVIENTGEGIPAGRTGLAGCEFIERFPGDLPEPVRVRGYPADTTDDAAVGNESCAGQVKQAGKQLSLGEIAGGAHQYDNLGKTRTYA